jgi:hypothetical protein
VSALQQRLYARPQGLVLRSHVLHLQTILVPRRNPELSIRRYDKITIRDLALNLIFYFFFLLVFAPKKTWR